MLWAETPVINGFVPRQEERVSYIYTADSSDTFHRKNRQEGGELEAAGKTQEKCTGEGKVLISRKMGLRKINLIPGNSRTHQSGFLYQRKGGTSLVADLTVIWNAGGWYSACNT
jgi:hypothetical protein